MAYHGLLIHYMFGDWGKLAMDEMLPLPETQQIVAPYLLLAA